MPNKSRMQEEHKNRKETCNKTQTTMDRSFILSGNKSETKKIMFGVRPFQITFSPLARPPATDLSLLALA